MYGRMVSVWGDLVVRMVVGLHRNAARIVLGVWVGRIYDGLGVDMLLLPRVIHIASVGVRR